MKLLRILLAMLLLPAAAAAQAQSPDTTPDALVKNVTNEVLEIVRKDKDIQAGSNKKARLSPTSSVSFWYEPTRKP